MLTNDPEQDRLIIADALTMPAKEYARRAAGLRAQTEREHGWDGIFQRIWDVVASIA